MKSGPSSAEERTSVVGEWVIRCHRAYHLLLNIGPLAIVECIVCRQRVGLSMPSSIPSAVEERAVRCRQAYRLPSKSGPSASSNVLSAFEERAVRFIEHTVKVLLSTWLTQTCLHLTFGRPCWATRPFCAEILIRVSSHFLYCF